MDIRKNFLTEETVLISELRAFRPTTFKKKAEISDNGEFCPFCLKNRHITPNDIYTYKDIRVIPNKYPAISEKDGLYGFHEVIIDSSKHDYTLVNGDFDLLKDLFMCFKQRIDHFKKDEKIKYIQIFKNHGDMAGASIFHTHWQLMALPFVPFKKETMSSNFKKYKEEKGFCYLCNEINSLGELKIFETKNVVAYCPFASLYYYGVNVSTKKHFSFFEDMEEEIYLEMATTIINVVKALNEILKTLSFNVCFHLAPLHENSNDWHFFIEVVPRFASFAGFELSTNCYINSLGPEKCSENLKKVLL